MGKVHSARAVVSRQISDDATFAEKEGAARRRLVATTGHCPCGAELKMPPQIQAGTVAIVSVEHEDGCPAIESEV